MIAMLMVVVVGEAEWWCKWERWILGEKEAGEQDGGGDDDEGR